MLAIGSAWNDSLACDGRPPAHYRGGPGHALAVPAPGNRDGSSRIPARILPGCDCKRMELRHETMTKPPDRALHKHICVLPEQRQGVERAAARTIYSPNQLLVELAMEAPDRLESLGTEAELPVARA